MLSYVALISIFHRSVKSAPAQSSPWGHSALLGGTGLIHIMDMAGTWWHLPCGNSYLALKYLFDKLVSPDNNGIYNFWFLRVKCLYIIDWSGPCMVIFKKTTSKIILIYPYCRILGNPYKRRFMYLDYTHVDRW